jgi:sialidase-1
MAIVDNKMTYRDALKGIRTSTDDGVTWSEIRPVYTGPDPGIPSAGVLLRTRRNVVVLMYVDHSTFNWGWDDARGEPHDDARTDVWSVRSLDDGEIWVNRHGIMEGYCGAPINMIETQRGPIVVPVQILLLAPGRHGQATLASPDQGKTWERSNIIDLGGSGHHDGAFESTIAELGDRCLWMLIRTNWDRYWEAFSVDEGLSWRVYNPSEIDASSSPGYLLRLASGRLVLVWNRLYAEGRENSPRRIGQLSGVGAWWQREELSLALSDDDGKSWITTAAIAVGEGLAYPYVLEHRAGELWVLASGLRVTLHEETFVP